MKNWSDKTETPVTRMLKTAEVAASRYYHWKHRSGKANEHNAPVPQAHWLEAEEKRRSSNSTPSTRWKAIVLLFHDAGP
jgi:hypothetical protein